MSNILTPATLWSDFDDSLDVSANALVSVSDDLAKKSFTSVENKFITKYLPVLEPIAVKVYLFSLYVYQNALSSYTQKNQIHLS